MHRTRRNIGSSLAAPYPPHHYHYAFRNSSHLLNICISYAQRNAQCTPLTIHIQNPTQYLS